MNSTTARQVLRPEDIVALGQWLSAHHIRVHPAQLIAATRLLSGETPPPPADELAPWLAPIFCTNSAEQKAFAGLYESWLGTKNGSAPKRETGRKDVPGNDGGKRERRWPVWLILVIVLVSLLAALYCLMPSYETTVVVTSDKQAVAGATIWTDKEGVKTSGGDPGTAVLKYRKWQLPIKVSASHPAYFDENKQPYVVWNELRAPQAELTLELPGRPKATTPIESERAELAGIVAAPDVLQKPDEVVPGPVEIFYPGVAGIASIALLPLVWWLGAMARRRGFLERMPSDNDESRRRLSLHARAALGAYVRDLRYLSRELRRRRTTSSRKLDIAATLAATVRSGGLPTMVFGTYSEPEYLMLVDRVSPADHQAHLADEVIHFFHAQGVCVDRYVFDGDPRYSLHAPLECAVLHQGTQNLELLFTRHPHSRLLVFSDGTGLIDPYSGKPAKWIKNLTEWTAPVLITPQPRELWALREWLLAQAGMVVLPLDGQGLHLLGDVLRHERSWPGVAPDARYRKRQAYLRDVDLLLDRKPMPDDQAKALVAELQRDLGEDGFSWFAACAIYPEIHWPITLAMGDALIGKQTDVRNPGEPTTAETHETRNAAYARRLAQMSRLPWMRFGYMPDWLRSQLMLALDPKQERHVRQKLNQVLLALKAEEDADIATPVMEVANTSFRQDWRDGLVGLRAWVTRRTLPPKSGDAVFLKFMSGARKTLAVDATDALVRLFYRKGIPLAGPRSWPLFAGLVLAILTGSVVQPWQRTSETRPGEIEVASPRLLALNDQGTALATMGDDGRVRMAGMVSDTLTVASCGQRQQPGIALTFDEGTAARYVATRQDGLEARTVSLPCKVSEDATPLPIQIYTNKPVVQATSYETSETRNKEFNEALCASVTGQHLALVSRQYVDNVLLKGRSGASACAFSGNGAVFYVLDRAGQIRRFDLRAGRISNAVLYTLPPAARDLHTLVLNQNGRAAAALSDDGAVWFSRNSGVTWRTLGKLDARAPLALSGDGRTIAFSTAEREIRIWKIMLPAEVETAGQVERGARLKSVPNPAPPRKELVETSKSVDDRIATTTVYFEDGSTVLSAENREEIDNFFAELSARYRLKELTVTGYSSDGNEEYDQRRALHLADTVKSYLATLGFDPARISISGSANVAPALTGASALRQANRSRVELRFVGIDWSGSNSAQELKGAQAVPASETDTGSQEEYTTAVERAAASERKRRANAKFPPRSIREPREFPMK